MSKLNDLDNDLIVIPDKSAMAKLWRERVASLANARKVEADLLEILVCYAYFGEQITEGCAAKTLGLDLLGFRELYQESYEKTFELQELL